MRKPPEFQLRPRRSTVWWAVAGAVVAHLLLLAIPATNWFWSDGPPQTYIIPIPVDLVQEPVEFPTERPPPPRPRRPPPPPPVVARGPEQPMAPAEVAVEEEPGVPGARADTAGPPVEVPAEAPTGIPRLKPAYGEGKLWVQPLPLPPQELAQRLTRSHFELVDSAVSAIVQSYIDSMLAAPARADAGPPSWTTEIAGRTFGIDSKYIHLGGFKIPSALLALLPIPQVSNVDLRYSQKMTAIREELLYAARRAETMEDFKRAIREIRERKTREREFERNQRRAPADSTDPP